MAAVAKKVHPYISRLLKSFATVTLRKHWLAKRPCVCRQLLTKAKDFHLITRTQNENSKAKNVAHTFMNKLRPFESGHL